MKLLLSRRVLITLAIVTFLVGVVGVGRPRKFHLHFGDVVVLEGPSGVVVIAQVQRGSRRAMIDDPVSGPTAYLFKSDVAPDSSVRTASYRPERYLSPRLSQIGFLGNDLFLLEWPGRPERRMSRFGSADDLEPATRTERDAFLDPGPSPEWHRLKRSIGYESSRHAIVIREESTESGRRLVAESLSKERPWRRVLVDVNSRPWYAYAGPFDHLKSP